MLPLVVQLGFNVEASLPSSQRENRECWLYQRSKTTKRDCSRRLLKQWGASCFLIFPLQFLKNQYTMLSTIKGNIIGHIVRGRTLWTRNLCSRGKFCSTTTATKVVCQCDIPMWDLLADAKGNGATVSKMETVQEEGGRRIRRTLAHYKLDAIIGVG